MTRPLRIAVFAHEFPALSETFVLNQIVGLIDRGHDVTIFATRARPEPRVHADIGRYRLDLRTRYRRMPSNKAARVLTAAALFLGRLWRGGRVLMRSLDVRRYGRDAASLNLFFWAVRTMEERPFDIVYCHFGPVGQLAAQLRDAGALTGSLVTVFHGVDVSFYVRNRPDYYRFLFSTGEMFLPVSERWRQKLADLGCDPDRMAVHHMGADAERIGFRPRRYEPGRPLRLLSVGRMVEKKGLAYGLEAMAELLHRGVSAHYALVGDGPLRAHLESMAEALGIAANVSFHGWQEQAAVAALMEASDVLLAPSVTTNAGDEEGIPVTIMEGMASGMIVVATEHSGIPELVQHGRSGMLVPEGDVQALVAALRRLVEDPAIWEEMGRNARSRILDRFDVRRLNGELEQLFQMLAEVSDRAPPKRDRAFGAREARVAAG